VLAAACVMSLCFVIFLYTVWFPDPKKLTFGRYHKRIANHPFLEGNRRPTVYQMEAPIDKPVKGPATIGTKPKLNLTTDSHQASQVLPSLVRNSSSLPRVHRPARALKSIDKEHAESSNHSQKDSPTLANQARIKALSLQKSNLSLLSRYSNGFLPTQISQQYRSPAFIAHSHSRRSRDRYSVVQQTQPAFIATNLLHFHKQGQQRNSQAFY